MKDKIFCLHDLHISPLAVHLYVPPIVWKGDCVGHVGTNDTFFFVLEGECFLMVGEETLIISPGQLAFLPKGKMRAYTHASEPFCMYEMAFSAEVGEENLMQLFGLTDHCFAVDVSDVDAMRTLFESSHRKELYKDPLYDLAWCSNILQIIRIYAEAHQKHASADKSALAPAVECMQNNLDRMLKTEELAACVHMQTTYFIRRFTAAYGCPPQNYFRRLKLYRAMRLLASTDRPIEEISRAVGFPDTSYFSRFFKQQCHLTPREYRAAFKRG